MSLLLYSNWSKIEKRDERSFALLFHGLSHELCNYIFQSTNNGFLSSDVVKDIFDSS